MKIIVIGGSGVLGLQILKHYASQKNEVFYTYLKNSPKISRGKNLDITQKNEVVRFFQKINPDIVFHTAAVTNVDLCEERKEYAEKINVIGTNNIVESCKKIQSKIVYLSTSAVFNGERKEYQENDKPSPTSIYGKTKLEGEKIVSNAELEYLILRTDQPYGWIETWQHTNSVLRVMSSLTEGKEFQEVVDWYNTPTYIPDFINTLKNLIDFKKTGTYHIVGNEFLSRFEWAEKIARLCKLNKKLLIPIMASKLHLAVKRNNVKLNNEKSFVDTRVKMSNVEEGLKKMLSDKINL